MYGQGFTISLKIDVPEVQAIDNLVPEKLSNN
jgi:hypothetical protein